MKLTNNELIVLQAFPNPSDVLQGDAGASYTDAKELANDTGKRVSSVKGILGSLVKKGMVYSDADDGIADMTGKVLPAAVCLTEDGARAALQEEEPEDATEPQGDPVAADPEEGEVGSFAEAFDAAGGNQPRGRCKALRSVAKQYFMGNRKLFIEEAATVGIKYATASANYAAAKRGEV